MPKPTKNQPRPDAENPEWTKEKFARAKHFSELPEGLKTILKGRTRGPQKAPTKELVSIRLSPDVVTAVRATGRGWQKLVDDTLRSRFVKS